MLAAIQRSRRPLLHICTTLFLVRFALLPAFGQLPPMAFPHGPVPYHSYHDSPFRMVSFDQFHLEDFEDGTLDVPGVSIANNKPGGAGYVVRTANPWTDSVDGDDGSIDGNGTGGRSYAPSFNDNSEPFGLTMTFDPGALGGSLPTHVGFAWTDGTPGNAVEVEFFDGTGKKITGIGPSQISDNSFQGTTSDDHFFGACSRVGIASVVLRTPTGTGSFEIDHLQYGIAPGPGPAEDPGAMPNAKPRVHVEAGRIFVHPDDSSGLFVESFRVASVSGGVVRDPSDHSMLGEGATFSVATGKAGLLASGPGVQLVVESVHPNTDAGLGSTPIDVDGISADRSVIQFQDSVIDAREGNLAIAIVHSSDPLTSARVHYEVLAGSAKPFDETEGDYFEVSGFLDLAEGAAVIEIPIFDDGISESAEDLFIQLFNPGGDAVLGPRSLARVRITDGFYDPLVDPLRQEAPRDPARNDQLTVTIDAPGVAPNDLGKAWRFVGEPHWRDSGDTATNLSGSMHLLEYRTNRHFSVPSEFDPDPGDFGDLVPTDIVLSFYSEFAQGLFWEDDLTVPASSPPPVWGSLEVSLLPASTNHRQVMETRSGTLQLPFEIDCGRVGQSVTTVDPAQGGLLLLDFTIESAGDYVISAVVDAPNNGANSFFINIDAEPVAPQMTWGIGPLTNGFEERTVSWTDSSPKVFNLGSGPHTLYLRGREAGTRIERIIVSPYSGSPDPGNRPQWRLVGESAWRESGERATLPNGKHLLEFNNSVPGYYAPTPRHITIVGSTNLAAAYVESPALGEEPVPLAYSGTIPSTGEAPYHFTGQFETPRGYSTGVVVANMAVLTAAAPLFDSSTMTFESGVHWRFRPDRDANIADPAFPSRTILSSDYAGVSVADEAAVVFFRHGYFFGESPGKEGFSGFLADPNPQPGFNPWITGTPAKTIASYPMHDSASGNWGMMHRTDLSTAAFAHESGQIFSGTGFKMPPGSEGSPLFAEHTNGKYYPTAICLGGTPNGARFRAIDDFLGKAIYKANSWQNTLEHLAYISCCDAVEEYDGNPSDQAGSGLVGYINALAIPQDATWTLVRQLAAPTGGGSTTTERTFSGGTIHPVEVGSQYTITANPSPDYLLADGAPVMEPVTITHNSIYTINAQYIPLQGDYHSWAGTMFDDLALENGTISGPDAIALWLGTTNFGAYAFGFDPTGSAAPFAEPSATPPTPGWPRFTINDGATPPTVTVDFLMRTNLDVDYVLEFADSPSGTWTAGGAPPTTTPIPGDNNWVTGGWTDVPFPLTGSATRFCRVRAVHAP